MTGFTSYRVSPFDRSSFSSPALLNPPQMEAQDAQRFLGSLRAQTAPELASTAELWENTFLPTYPVPFFLVRVADIRASLNSSATALLLYQEARKLIDSDPVFDDFIASFEQQCRKEEESNKERWSQGIFNQPWKSTSKFLFPIIPLPPDMMPDLEKRWKAMTDRQVEQRQRYFRYLCIETNILEQAFLLDPQSITHLIRVGYVDQDAEYVSKSKLQDKRLITSILRDTHEALEMIWAVANDTEKFTVDFLIDLHRVCLKTSKILPIKTKDNGAAQLQYTNVGVTRQQLRKNVLLPGPPRVQFSPFENVLDEMGRITHLARQWLKNWKKNPFATSAWLHLVFASCHPFEDGNGRVARLAASIPLIQAGLPPLCIPAIAKKSYYEGLNRARENNYDSLIRCFVQALDTSLSAIENLESHPSAITHLL